MASFAMTTLPSVATFSCIHPIKHATIGVYAHHFEPNQVFELLIIDNLINNLSLYEHTHLQIVC
tara:strand:+ start:101 stop:292 length:192 start_codon:yes stop_codon:yes gene_type:complete